MDLICFNGNFLPSDQALFTAENRSFKWGDGVFETIKVVNGHIILEQFHFERLFLSLRMLKMEVADSIKLGNLAANIIELCKKNNCINLARVRLAVFRVEGNMAWYVIQAFPLSSETNRLNEKGWVIGLYPYSRKNLDAFSNLKTANFLPYVLSELYAKENGLDDALVLNAASNICESSKATVFLIRNEEVYTPALNQGCINGVMRRHLIGELKKTGVQIRQQEITEEDLLLADEVFLTNAIIGMRWVEQFKNRTYSKKICQSLYGQFFSTLYGGLQL